eukprot:5628313-Alexandrium_andersonii.AAC.1
MQGPIRRAAFLKGKTEDEARLLPIQIQQARIAPVAHEHRRFQGFDIDSRAGVKVADKYEGNHPR